jgi:small multidrug resistance pump
LPLVSLPPYLLLAVAILAEVVATVSLKLADGFSRHGPLAAVAVGYAIAFWLLSVVLQQLPVGRVYAIWAGCGVAGAAFAGALLFGERLGPRDLAGFACVVIGVALLSFRSSAH